jgi:hypothetical protein
MIIDFPDAAAKLKVLAKAEAEQRPSLSEYPERTGPTKIPLLAIDVEQHDLEGRQVTGIWCLNHGPLDEFSSEFMELAANLGKGLAGRPRAIDPLTFLLHNLSLYLWHREDRQRADFVHLKLLTKPLANGVSIQVQQIVSLIKATELYARQLTISATTGRRPFEVQDSPTPPWLRVEEANNRPGFQAYPKWVGKPDGRRGIVSTVEEHARLFTEDWLTRGIVTTLPNTDGEPRASGDELAPPKLEANVIKNWESIEIVFLSDERVRILNGANVENYNYGELGFADGRTEKPNQAWVTLRVLASTDGVIRDAARTGGDWPKVEKRIQEIRRALRQHFHIAADPVPFIEGTGYQARFKIRCSPSFET